MSMINLHEMLKATDVEERSLAEDRGKSEIRFGDLTTDAPFRAGVEYTPPARGTWTIAHTPMLVPDSLEIYVCPEGCLRGVVLSAAEFDGLDRFAMITVKENNLYDNHMEDLFIDGTTDILERRDSLPKVVFLFASCIHHMLATDMNYVYRTLRARFPDVKFVEANMDCTMRKSRIFYEEAVNRQLYVPLDPRPMDSSSVSVIGNYFPLFPGSEVCTMLQDAGLTLRDINTVKNYEEYQELACSSLYFYDHPMARVATETLAERLGGKSLYVPYCWDYSAIDQELKDLATAASVPLPDLDSLREEAEKSLAELREKIGDTEIQIDASATPRPLELAKLLLSHGFRVTAVYADAISGEEANTRDWLKENAPDLKFRSIVNFRGRVNPRDEAEKAGGNLLAIGQKAAYFTGTRHFVNIIYQSGLLGYRGISELCRLMADAMDNEKVTEEFIQFKAWGCHA